MRRTLSALLCAALVAGCSSDRPPPQGGANLDPATAADLAVQAAASVAVLEGHLELAIASTPATAPAALRAAWDTTVVRDGLTYEASRTFYDAADQPLPGPGPDAVRVEWTGRAAGTRTAARDTATVGHSTLLDLDGIAAGQDTLRFVGVSGDTLDIRFRTLDDTGRRFYRWESDLLVEEVRYLEGAVAAGPIGGTVSLLVAAARLRSADPNDVEARFTTVVVVTFDGSGTARIVVDDTYAYDWDLATGEVVRR